MGVPENTLPDVQVSQCRYKLHTSVRVSNAGTYIITDAVYKLGAEGGCLATRQVNSIYFPITTREAGWGAEAGNGD